MWRSPRRDITLRSTRTIALAAVAVALLALPALGQENDPATDPERGVSGLVTVEDTPPGYASRHALVIGIDDYQDPGFPDLGHAAADARGVAKLLVEQLGFEPDRVRLVLNGDATKDNLDRELEEWACDRRAIGKNDLVVVFFAGHGVTRDLGGRGQRGYLVPVDGARRGQEPAWSSLIDMDDFEGVSEAIPAKHVLFILDCCFGGLAVTRAPPPLAAGLSNRARQVITAGSAEQVVFDGGGGGHSVFTAAVLDALRGQADLDGDRVVTFGELYNQVGRTVEMKTERRQTPLQATLPDHEGGCVALFPPGVKPAASTVAERLMALERTAEERLAEIERLSDAVTIRKLRTAADELWPCVPDKVADMTAWLVQAKEIVGRRPVHEDSLLRLRQEAYLKQVLAGTIEEGELAEPVWDEVEPKLRWRYETTQDLVTDLEELAATVTDVEKRLAFARTVREKSVEMYSVEWREAIASIANQKECPAYEGLVMTPQLGLVPLGRDPASGLQEFAHLQTGEIPYRDDEEHLVIDKEMGIVF